MANRFLTLSPYNPLRMYQSLAASIKFKLLQKIFIFYYKWPILITLNAIYLFIVNKHFGGGIVEIILFFSLILLLFIEVAYEITARLILGSIDNMRQYTSFNILNVENRENTQWDRTQLLRGFFLTLSAQLFCFCVAYAALFKSISNHSVDQFNIGALTITESIYFSVTSLTTTGYGDIVPTGIHSRLLVMSEMIVVYMFVIFMAAHFALSLTDNHNKKL